MNRVAAAIAKMEQQIKDRLANGLTTQEGVERCHRDLDMTIEEHVRFQELKSVAVCEEKLSVDEGQLIYNLLGGTASVFNAQPVHVKAVLTSIFKELLEARLQCAGTAGRRAAKKKSSARKRATRPTATS